MARNTPTRTSRRTLVLATTAAMALGLGAMLPATAQAAPSAPSLAEVRELIPNAQAAGTVTDSYIVQLRDNVVQAESAGGERIAESHGAEIVDEFPETLNGYAVEATLEEALELAADPAVATITQNQRVSVAATQPNPPSWGLDRIDQPDLPLNQSYTYPDHGGQGVTAYVLDTGVRTTHTTFGGRASFGYDYFNQGGADGHGHGTHVAGTIAGATYGVAKAARIVNVRVLNNSGGGTTASVVGGIEWVTANHSGPSVANMSLGGGVDTTLDAAVRASIASGVTYAVAAGNNSGANASNYSPARVSEAITVASSQSNDARSSFSNIGAVVDIYAPGTGITSSWGTSDTASSTISGTSMATPHVAGAAALYLATNPSATPAQVRNALVAAGEPNTVTNAGTSTTTTLLQVG
ncbi:S8 family peptidase [Streptomyces hainanensis]|uniref:S8 family peptidase n=1 Tax=Streptomyces hainanensis TaxID=402648 RepID=A0A4R4TNM4_9ACTN|nr:S8 family peptidase [Streptomyces hainanensis]